MMPSSHSLVAEEHLQATCTIPSQVWTIQAAPGSLEELQLLVIRGDVGVEGVGRALVQS